MGESGALGWRAGLAALVLGAGACYGLARLARSGGAAAAPRGTSGRGGACERRSDGDLPKSTDSLDANHLQKLIQLLESTDDPLIQEQILVTLSNSAAFSVNQDIIRNLDGLSVIGKMVSDSIPKVKEKALNALNNLSMNVKNQEELKEYIVHVCREIESSPLDSELQLAGLRLLTNMSVTNNYHPMMTRSIPYFFHLLSEGNERTQIQVLKVLVNLSANPAMTRHLLSSQAPSLLSLFDNFINKDVLLRALVFVTNLNKNMKNARGATIQDQYNEDSIFSTLFGDSTQYAQKLASLLHHPDTEVKEQVVKIITQQ
ncbi:armadillo repeat-containing protein 10 isoform X1 [Alligator mississippiensis]|uniref:armadillo repeat-containing protein 10 isoform X1 n=1 Tax=Alligator mississippiensis TaxID=8496 RepID=UPI002877F0DB|nr:armadillo repeat-containing protein 10 isoform X1 [Alligator mississippiensis]